MMQRDYFVSLLQKYGMDSNFQEPYLCEIENKFGYYYSFFHEDFNLLRRIFIPENEFEADDFLYRFWWFKKYQTEFSLTMLLDDYESKNANPIIMKDGNALSSTDMKALVIDKNYDKKQTKKRKRYHKLLRTSRILIKIIEEKVKIQNDTYRSVMELNIELKKQENEFYHFYNRLQKEQKALHQIDSFLEEDLNLNHEIQYLQEQIDGYYESEKNESELVTFIDSLWKMLYGLESENGHLQNKYLLISLPIRLEDIRKKKSYLEYITNKKKGLFSKKEDFLGELAKIDSESEIHKIVQMDDYIQNEIKRLKEKYAIIADLDLTTLGDYLNEFDNLSIVVPEETIEDKKDILFTREESLQFLKEKKSILSEEIQRDLVIYHSFLQPICDELLKYLKMERDREMILKETYQQFQKELEESLLILNHADNIILRLKYFKGYHVTNTKLFLECLLKTCENLSLNGMIKLSEKMKVYGKNRKDGTTWNIYHASLKSMEAPTQSLGQDEITDIFILPKSFELFFVPDLLSIKEAYLGNLSLEENNNKEDLVLFLKNKTIKYLNSDIIKVIRYQPITQFSNGLKVVTNIKVLKEENYRMITIDS